MDNKTKTNKQIPLLIQIANGIFDTESKLRNQRFELLTLILREAGGELDFSKFKRGEVVEIVCGGEIYEASKLTLINDENYEVFFITKDNEEVDLEDVDEISVANTSYDKPLEFVVDYVLKLIS